MSLKVAAGGASLPVYAPRDRAARSDDALMESGARAGTQVDLLIVGVTVGFGDLVLSGVAAGHCRC